MCLIKLHVSLLAHMRLPFSNGDLNRHKYFILIQILEYTYLYTTFIDTEITLLIAQVCINIVR